MHIHIYLQSLWNTELISSLLHSWRIKTKCSDNNSLSAWEIKSMLSSILEPLSDELACHILILGTPWDTAVISRPKQTVISWCSKVKERSSFWEKECWGCGEMIYNVLSLEAYSFLTALRIAKIPVLLCRIGHTRFFILLIRSVKMMG